MCITFSLKYVCRLYKNEDKKEWAAHYYERYVQQAEERGVVEGTTSHTEAFEFLAHHYLSTHSLDAATYYAHKCCEYRDVRFVGASAITFIYFFLISCSIICLSYSFFVFFYKWSKQLLNFLKKFLFISNFSGWQTWKKTVLFDLSLKKVKILNEIIVNVDSNFMTAVFVIKLLLCCGNCNFLTFFWFS